MQNSLKFLIKIIHFLIPNSGGDSTTKNNQCATLDKAMQEARGQLQEPPSHREPTTNRERRVMVETFRALLEKQNKESAVLGGTV